MNALIAFALRQRVLILALFVMAFAGGIVAFRQLNIEAYPDPTPPMVDIITQSPGLSAEEIERYIAIPITLPVLILLFLRRTAGSPHQGRRNILAWKINALTSFKTNERLALSGANSHTEHT